MVVKYCFHTKGIELNARVTPRGTVIGPIGGHTRNEQYSLFQNMLIKLSKVIDKINDKKNESQI
jgi:hypothetical protein